MTYEEVKAIRENRIGEVYDMKELQRLIDIAIDKQIPKPPIKIIRKNFSIKYYCPICNSDEIKGYDYCSSCGQKLDWSEVSHKWV
jgi:hypothetical protein